MAGSIGSVIIVRMKNSAEVLHLSKRYGDHIAVDDLSFSIPLGGVVGLIGPNGAGKTTTLKMLLGLVKPTGGDIQLLDAQVGAAGWGSVLKRVGSMIEEPPIYDRMTARQNLRYQSLAVTGRIDDQQIDEILQLVDLVDRADDRPRAYSLGMKQRLGIGISLIGNPELVLLDEPANGLDPMGIIDIRNLLRRLPENGTTVLVSSHQLAEVQQACDRLIILANGRLVTQGTVDDILGLSTSHMFRVSLAEIEMERGRELFTKLGYRVDTAGSTALLIAPPADIAGDMINRFLVDAGIYASEITKPTVSLEDAFLDLVSTQPVAHDVSTIPPLNQLDLQGSQS